LQAQVREHQTIRDALSAERAHAQEKSGKAEKEVEARKQLLAHRFQAQLAQVQAELDTALNSIDQRRQRAVKAEAHELQGGQRGLIDQIATIDHKLKALTQSELDEKDRTLKSLRDGHVQVYLQNQSIYGARIPGIGETYKTRLRLGGFNSAADISYGVRRIEGIGHARYAALQDWKQLLESNAKQTAPFQLSRQDSANIENRFLLERQLLEGEKKKQQASLQAYVTEIRKKYAIAKHSVDEEERQLRAEKTKEMAAIKQSEDAQVSSLAEEVIIIWRKSAPITTKLTEQIRLAHTKLFALQLQTTKKEKEVERFRSIGFRYYLKKMIWS
jgi:DNA-binding helix-hairpin-helix protein with protein kinase domain